MNTPPDNDEPFLARWSRRKQAIAKGESLPADAVQGESADGEPGPAEAVIGGGQKPELEEELDLSTLPKVEELDERSDITAFLDRRVPAALRNAALGRMWTLDPTIRDFIEVAENQWNWNVPGGAPFYEPLEGGAEIAESIVRGLTPAVQAVADAAETVTSDSTLVASAEGATASTGVVQAGSTNPVALQQVAGSSDVEQGACDTPSSEELQAKPDVVLGNAASQHVPVTGQAPEGGRRRHGGALPA